MESPSTGRAEPPSSRVRAIFRLSLIALWTMACVIPHLAVRGTGRSRWPRRYLAGCARIAGARVRVAGDPVRPHSMLLCNHISWLDIMVAADATGCRFVAKHELARGPIHWFAAQNNTLFVDRNDRRGSRGQALEIAAALSTPQPVALFPEGQVGPGDRLLPFRSTLVEAAALASRAVEIRPVAIDYGAAAAEISWLGESGRSNALRLLGRRGVIAVTVHLLAPLPAGQGRKALAAQAHRKIADALFASDSAAPRLYAGST